jgi:hypothetical protein
MPTMGGRGRCSGGCPNANFAWLSLC